MADTSKVAPAAMEIVAELLIEPALPKASVPELIVVAPVKVFVPFKIKVPVPIFDKPPLPLPSASTIAACSPSLFRQGSRRLPKRWSATSAECWTCR